MLLNLEPETLNLEPQLFVGDANQAEARVYAALPRTGLSADAQLAGEFVGPFCRYSQTLPARMRFVDRGPGPTLLAEAVVPDPCFWTPDLPFMYRATVQVANAAGASTTFASVRPFGIRRLGVQGSSLYLDAKRFVLRGVRHEAAEVGDLKAARESASALYVSDPSDDFLREASEEGVLLAMRLEKKSGLINTSEPLVFDPTELTTELARLARWPAVAIVVLDGDILAGKELRLAARNTLLAQLHASSSIAPLRPWAHLFWWVIGPTTPGPRPSAPVVVFDGGAEIATIAKRRRNCDRLQAELAPLGDYAGYFT